MSENKNRWAHKLSAFDYRDIGPVAGAFKMTYDFYIPETASVLDLCAGKKLMYRGYEYPNVEFNDIQETLDTDYHFDCRTIASYLNKKYDWFVYDPPYVDIKGRVDKREDDYGYELVGSLDDFKDMTLKTKAEMIKLMDINDSFYTNGVIAKITDFHWDGKLHGHHDLVEWFEPEFYIWDLRVYRWYRRALNINWYKKKCFKTHSYFLIFKPDFNVIPKKQFNYKEKKPLGFQGFGRVPYDSFA